MLQVHTPFDDDNDDCQRHSEVFDLMMMILPGERNRSLCKRELAVSLLLLYTTFDTDHFSQTPSSNTVRPIINSFKHRGMIRHRNRVHCFPIY